MTHESPSFGYNYTLGMSLRNDFVDLLAISYLGQRLDRLPETKV